MRHSGYSSEDSVYAQAIRLAVDTIPTLVWSARPDGSADFFNQRWLEYTGLTLEQALEWGWKTAVHPADLPRVLGVFQEALNLVRPFNVEGRFRRFDGEYRWFLFRGNPLCDQSGKVVKWYGTNTDLEDRIRAEDVLRADIETRKQIEVRLRENEAHLLEVQRLTRTGSWRLNTTSGKVTVSPEVLRRYDVKPDEDISNPEFWFRRIHPDDRKWVRDLFERSVAQKTDYQADYRILLPDGTVKHQHSIGHPVLNEAGNLVEFVGTTMEVTEQVQAREKLEKAFAEIKFLKEQLQKENVALREEVDRVSMFEEIVGTSRALQRVLSRASKVAPTDSTVLITGETGTGKELIARAIHKRSPRAGRAFVSVNCAALAPSLILSELFGHEKGAFTGAAQRRLGRFELANAGTIFLDEVGDLPLDTQIALLRVLQEREFERVGGKEAIKVDVRVVAATNRDLEAAQANGSFRADLYYRLSVFPIEMPPLRQRKEDLLVLMEYFVHRYGQKAGKSFRNIDPRTLDLFQAYDWPGNIRELQNVVERSVIVSFGDTFRVDEAWMSRACDQTKRESTPWAAGQDSSDERQIIEAALAESRGRVSGPKGAAAKLGVPPSTLDSRIKKLEIRKSRFKLG
jgi:PAS domain S-box-containing protein